MGNVKPINENQQQEPTREQLMVTLGHLQKIIARQSGLIGELQTQIYSMAIHSEEKDQALKDQNALLEKQQAQMMEYLEKSEESEKEQKQAAE